MIVGRLISSEIVENRDSDAKVVLLMVEIADPDDLQHVELFRQPGIDAHPTEDSSVLMADVGRAWKVAIATDDQIEPEVSAGEIAIYASEGGEKKSQVYCKTDGNVEVGTASPEYVAIASKVDQFISDVVTMFSNWTPVAMDGGAALKSLALSTWPVPPATTASTNLKAEP